MRFQMMLAYVLKLRVIRFGVELSLKQENVYLMSHINLLNFMCVIAQYARRFI